MAVHPAVAGDVFDDVLFCAPLFSHEMSWMRSEIELSQFQRILLPILCFSGVGRGWGGGGVVGVRK